MQQHLFGILFTLFVISLSSCASTPPPPDPALEKHPPFTVIDQGSHSGLTLAKHLVIYSADDWQELWQVHTNKPLPKIDFSKDMVIAVFLGEYPTGGYIVGIHELEKSATALQVSLNIQSPTPGSVLTMELSQPFVIIKTGRNTLPINFTLYQNQVQK